MTADPSRLAVTLTVAELEELVQRKVAGALEAHEPSVKRVVLTRGELAEALGVSLSHVANLQAEGMPCLRVGDAPRFEIDDVMEWLRNGRRSGAVKRKLLTPREWADSVGISRTKAYRAIKDGLPTVMVGASKRIDPDAAIAWLKEHRS